MTTWARSVVDELEASGVEICFGLPGVHTLVLFEELRQSPIRMIGVRHEQAAVYAADGYARATGKLGVAITTTGPGAANTLGALGEAWASRSPVLLIATDIPRSLRREDTYRGVLHETPRQETMFESVTKARFVSDHHPAGAYIRSAITAATTAPARPVLLQIPTDELSANATGILNPPSNPTPHPDQTEIQNAANLLNSAANPLIWVGGGAREASSQICALAEKLTAPVLTTYGARGVIPLEHPFNVTMPPHVKSVGELWDEADVVLALGTDFDGMNTQNWAMPQPKQLVAINIDVNDAAKNYTPNILLEGDAARVTDELITTLNSSSDPTSLTDRLHHVEAKGCDSLDERALRFLDALSFALPPESLLVCDMCIPGYWAAGFHGFHVPRKLQYPVGWGTLGFAFPAAIGAALSRQGPTVALCGDGGFLFACGELATVKQEQVPLTTVIVDDGGYGMLRYDQQFAGREEFAVNLDTPDFVALAEAFGIKAQKVQGLDEEFGEALLEHISNEQASVLVAEAEALVPPPTTSPRWYRKRSQPH